MHTSPTHDDKGHVTGFEISNLLINRGGVVKLLRTIPTVTITKSPKRWALDDDDFVHFTMNEHLFKVIEPFGDNSRYWIVAEDAAGQGEVEGIRKVFDAHNFLGGLMADWPWRETFVSEFRSRLQPLNGVVRRQKKGACR